MAVQARCRSSVERRGLRPAFSSEAITSPNTLPPPNFTCLQRRYNEAVAAVKAVNLPGFLRHLVFHRMPVAQAVDEKRYSDAIALTLTASDPTSHGGTDKIVSPEERANFETWSFDIAMDVFLKGNKPKSAHA